MIKCLGAFQNALGTFRNAITHATLLLYCGMRPEVVPTSPDVPLGAFGRAVE